MSDKIHDNDFKQKFRDLGTGFARGYEGSEYTTDAVFDNRLIQSELINHTETEKQYQWAKTYVLEGVNSVDD